MTNELNQQIREGAENKANFKRFSPLQIAIAGLGGALILIVLLLVISLSIRGG